MFFLISAQSASVCSTPTGATFWRGRAEERQMESTRTALQHNVGLSSAAVVTIYQADA